MREGYESHPRATGVMCCIIGHEEVVVVVAGQPGRDVIRLLERLEHGSVRISMHIIYSCPVLLHGMSYYYSFIRHSRENCSSTLISLRIFNSLVKEVLHRLLPNQMQLLLDESWFFGNENGLDRDDCVVPAID